MKFRDSIRASLLCPVWSCHSSLISSSVTLESTMLLSLLIFTYEALGNQLVQSLLNALTQSVYTDLLLALPLQRYCIHEYLNIMMQKSFLLLNTHFSSNIGLKAVQRRMFKQISTPRKIYCLKTILTPLLTSEQTGENLSIPHEFSSHVVSIFLKIPPFLDPRKPSCAIS